MIGGFRMDNSIIVEGMTAISAIINSQALPHHREIYEILFDRERAKKHAKRLAFLKAKAIELGFKLTICSEADIDALAEGKTHGGVLARVSPMQMDKISPEQLKKNGFYVVLEGAEDPYSLGYSIRSLYAAGADGIILPRRQIFGADATVSKSSAGASELIPLYSDELTDSVKIFKDLGYKIAAAEIRNSVEHSKADLSRPLLLIIGGEKRGISSSILDQCDFNVRIAYGGDFHGSLTTACAVSVLAFEVLRQNK